MGGLVKPLNLGVIGLSPGNGHPFSFSAIINGFNDAAFADSGWPGIHAYLRRRTPEEFGFPNVRVTHAWTQDADLTLRLQRAAHIDHAVPRWHDLIGKVDAVLLARDDHESHAEMAFPFLDAGVPVFIDKPLTTRLDELHRFYPHIAAGRAFTCSGLRYCGELDAVRADPAPIGRLMLARCVVLNDWPKYGVHMLDAVLPLTRARPTHAARLLAPHQSIAVTLRDPSAPPEHADSLLTIDALGPVAPVFSIALHGDKGHLAVDIRDNFTAFRRSLAAFIRTVRSGVPAIPPEDVWASVATIITGHHAAPGAPPTPIPPPPASAGKA